jgi:hypothetical protein
VRVSSIKSSNDITHLIRIREVAIVVNKLLEIIDVWTNLAILTLFHGRVCFRAQQLQSASIVIVNADIVRVFKSLGMFAATWRDDGDVSCIVEACVKKKQCET